MNYSKVVLETDPDVFKHFKHLVDERSIRVVTNALESDDGDGPVTPDLPVVAPCQRMWKIRQL